MNKEKIVKRVQEKLAGSYFGPQRNYAPPHAIWFQRQDNLRAFVSLVNNKYKYEIYDDNTGKPVKDDSGTGSEDTLPLAKKEVFEYFDKHPTK